MPTRGSSSTVRPTPICQTTSWPCSSHSPTTRPPTGNPWPCGRSSTPSATSAAPTHKCSPHPEISETKPRTRTTNASNYTTSTDSTTFSPHSNASPASTASTGKAHSPDAHAPQAPSETSTKAIPSQQIRGFLITDEDRRSALAHLRGELQTSPAMKKLLLIRANEQKAGYRITRPRSLKALPIMPEQVNAKSDFAAWPESVRDHWANRIGNLVLSQANETQVAPLATYAQRRDRMLLSASSRRFPLTAELANIAECTPQTLQYRQDEMVRSSPTIGIFVTMSTIRICRR